MEQLAMACLTMLVLCIITYFGSVLYSLNEDFNEFVFALTPLVIGVVAIIEDKKYMAIAAFIFLIIHLIYKLLQFIYTDFDEKFEWFAGAKLWMNGLLLLFCLGYSYNLTIYLNDGSNNDDNDSYDSYVYYKNCTDAASQHVYNIYSDEPGYRRALDADNDGIACER